MTKMTSLRPSLLFTLTCILLTNHACSKNDRKNHIVYMGHVPMGMDPASLPSLHAAMAQNVLGSNFTPEAVLHSYKNSFNGFVIELTREEAARMEEMDNVVSVFPSKKHYPQTTRSWDFIGFPQLVKRTSIESEIIVGVIDTGIWPASESFSDKGFGPPPSKWKGSCHNFTCNNKIIGAKYYNTKNKYKKDDIRSPIDSEGHGSHCASTAAGNLVDYASLLGYASGIARGGVPLARIAVYKVCWVEGCDEVDILRAFDDAIADGVDIISASVGDLGLSHFNFFEDAIDIGGFHAMKKGILTSHSTGNRGPMPSSITSYSPWLLSVAASSTMDRKFNTKVQLGDGRVYKGYSINTFDLKGQMFPIIYGGDAPNIAGGYNSSVSKNCEKNSLNKHLVKGKIVLCVVKQGVKVGILPGAVGVILGGTTTTDIVSLYPMPTILVSLSKFRRIEESNSTATIFKSEEVKDSLAPYIASFSSRGPNPFEPNILKPDLAAPGVNILAAWSQLSPISSVKGDKRLERYNVISGTSMACPHVTGAAAYIKSFHPDWSPAMIKSALMTTASPLSPALNSEAEFAYGAGQINPIKATNPGLVYDINEVDYIKFLCGKGISTKKLRKLTQDNIKCSKEWKANKKAAYDLNLPSFSLYVNDSTFSDEIFHRTVTNVGSTNSTYKAKVVSPSLLDIQVIPDTLSFTSVGQKKSFSIILEGVMNMVTTSSASLVWDDGTFQVRSPIIVFGDQAFPETKPMWVK